MAVTWNVYHGDFNGANFLEILYANLEAGNVVEATTDHATLEHNGQSVVFNGDLILNMGEVTAGMVHSLQIYDGETLIAEASGYCLDTGVIGDAAENIQNTGSASYLFDMLSMQPVTFNGSGDQDLFIDGDFGSTFYGQAGRDSFIGQGGNDVMYGGDGKDNGGCGGHAAIQEFRSHGSVSFASESTR